MSETKHTPGPWQVAASATREVVSMRGACVVATPSCPIEGDRGAFLPQTLVERDANARLIAAAPDLLAACKAAREALSGDGMPATPERGLRILATLEAAITKAEGK